MPTLLQLIRSHGKRRRKIHKSSVPLLAGCPQKKAICLKVRIVKPKNQTQRNERLHVLNCLMIRI